MSVTPRRWGLLSGALAILLLGAFAVLASTSMASSSASTARETVQAAKCDGGGVKVALVLSFRFGGSQQIVDGAKLAAKECNLKLDVTGPVNVDGPAAVRDFKNEIAAGAKGLVVIAFPPQFWHRPLTEAVDQGIPTLMTNVATSQSKVKTFVGIDGYAESKAMGIEVGKKLGASSTGPVIVGVCAPGNTVLTRRFRGVRDGIHQVAKQVKVVGPIGTATDPAASAAVWQQQIRANPDAKAFIGLCGDDTELLGKLKKKLNGNWIAAGSDVQAGIIQGIKNGSLTAAVSQNLYMQGYLPVRLLARTLQTGKPLPVGWLNPGWEILTPSNQKKVLPHLTSLKSSVDFERPRIEKILANPKPYFVSLSQLYGGLPTG